MSESPPPPNGTNITVVGAVHKLSSQLISAMTPQFLALVVVNIAFLGLFIWYIGARADHAASIMQQLLDNCLAKGGKP